MENRWQIRDDRSGEGATTFYGVVRLGFTE